MKKSFAISIALSGLVAATTLSCSRMTVEPCREFPVEALRVAGPVYSAFDSMLRREPKDNDFVRFSSNPENYKVVVTSDGDGFVFVFSLNSYRGRQVLDGSVTYRVTKDGRVSLMGKL